jgi:hypothetical protein
MSLATPNYNGAPQTFSGARARFYYDSNPVGYASGVSGEESVDYEPVEVLDLLEVREHVPVAYRVTLSAQIFRIVGDSLKQQGIFPKPEDIITSNAMSAHLEDKVSGKNPAAFTGVRCAGHSFDVTARGIVSENVNFVAIRVKDESGN